MSFMPFYIVLFTGLCFIAMIMVAIVLDLLSKGGRHSD